MKPLTPLVNAAGGARLASHYENMLVGEHVGGTALDAPVCVCAGRSALRGRCFRAVGSRRRVSVVDKDKGARRQPCQ